MSTTYIEFRNQPAATNAPPQLVFGVARQPDDQPDVMPWNLSSATDPLGRFDAQAVDPISPGVFRQTGESLFAELSKHPDFVQLYNDTVAAEIGDAGRMMLIRCKPESTAHAFPWEALYDPNGFAALRHQLPFARLVKPKKSRSDVAFDGKLRLVAIIGADGEPGAPQWDALQQALGAWQGEIDARVFVDSVELLSTVSDAKLLGVTGELMPQFTDQLLARIGQHVPQVVHIFCHGNPDGGGQLEIANLLTAGGEKPLVIGAEELAPALASAWLVTLNACGSGGAVEPGSSSFACTLVEQGVPYVVGMRQRVGADVAHAFAGAFLAGAFTEFNRAWESGAKTWTPNFGAALTSARNRIVTTIGLTASSAGRQKAWTLPIMCAAVVPLHVTLREPTDPAAIARQAQLDQLRDFLATNDPPVAIRGQIEARVADLAAAAGG